MSLSMYDVSIPVFVRMLQNLNAILDKSLKYVETKKFDASVLVNARLAPDMLPLSKQIQIASDMSKGCAARLAGQEVPSFPDTETNMSELQARIQKTIGFLKGFTPEKINNTESRDITIKIGGKDVHLKGQDYLLGFVLPNFYFHITTAYAILRHNGLDIGKKDYLGAS